MQRIASALDAMGELDRIASGGSAIHRLDARVKIITTLVFVLSVASFGRYATISMLPLAAYPLLQLIAGEVPIRVLRTPLLFSLPVALLVGIANPFLDTAPVVLGDGATGATIAAGWLSFASILLRTCLCVSAAVLLLATTGMPRIGHALRCLGVPPVFVSQLHFLYRYAFLLGDTVLATSRASQLRGGRQSLSISTYGALVGHLLLRTLDRAERIHLAMRCRGFTGTLPVGETSPVGSGDLVFLLFGCGMILGLRVWPVTTWLATLSWGGSA